MNDITTILLNGALAISFIMVGFTVCYTMLSYGRRNYDYSHDKDEVTIREQLHELTTIPKYMEQWDYNSERDVFVLKVGDDVLTLWDMALDINEQDIDCGDDLDDEIEEAFERLSDFHETSTNTRNKGKILEVMGKVLK